MFATNIPIGIDTQANHIITSTIFLKSIEDKIITFRIVGTIQMNNNFRFWKYLFYSYITGICQSCILVHIIMSITCRP